jgi:hypothetical protein
MRTGLEPLHLGAVMVAPCSLLLSPRFFVPLRSALFHEMICAASSLCRFVLVDDLNKSDVRSSPSAALSTPFLCLTLEEQTTVAHTYFQLVDQADPPPHCPLWPGAGTSTRPLSRTCIV